MNRRDKQKAETFTDIMRSAEDLFMRHGYEKTSMQQIADNAGLTKGALYHYFDSKEALLERMCADHNAVMFYAVKPILEDGGLSCFARIKKVLDLAKGMGISSVSFVSEYLKNRNDEGSVMLKARLQKYDRKFYADVVGPLLKEAREKKECDFLSSPEVLAVFIQLLDSGVSEEIHRVFAEKSGKESEAQIIDIMKTYVYTLSRMLNTKTDEISRLIGLEESMHFYGAVMRAVRDLKQEPG
ncbi:MAG: TetR/AcrR family transcriptional regulator [Treponema sp.]|jgi:AcrR family transcriptional regulator|nr:TetR/AcrR family transcriptional regulator [Treponema sp.]